ncbi:hypothetical protein EDM53_02075 [Rickettsiales endosymbiont of Peranema trichophorum]|uniref:hypothetical protein n=1 Tax=Rickettsiales endosymbiont of Peranema trichophorum TaxID=2486577 RepID=UPI00102304A7|nr:hypothetical protein [Rickettsiales endosymbiont of Peranema trichophorum]RZI47406.1 hypothetical protein EDM53_02075 [Rickettsiales endosymbiont of Peranema trichophorum]
MVYPVMHRFWLRVLGVTVLLTVLVLLVPSGALTLELKREEDKAELIKNMFKDRQIEPGHADGMSKKAIKRRERILHDFVTQNGIEHIEPIAVGTSIDDPEIAKFNVACPDRKPINMYKTTDMVCGKYTLCEFSEEELENPEWAYMVDEYRCQGNLKVFKFNMYNVPGRKDDYVLYCDDLIRIRNRGEVVDESDKRNTYYGIEGTYLVFSPSKCLYSKDIGGAMYSQLKDYMSGVFRYKGKYHFYSIYMDEASDWRGEGLALTVWSKIGMNNGFRYGGHYYKKEVYK